jgi:hypothetical protein
LAPLSRRTFLSHAAVGVTGGTAAAAAVGITVGHGLTGAVVGTSGSQAPLLPPGEHVIVHLRDVTTGEIAVMSGAREIVYRDAEVVARLLRGAQQAAASGRG